MFYEKKNGIQKSHETVPLRGGLISCHISCVDLVWANSKGSLLQVQHPATQIQLNGSCDKVLVWVGWGWRGYLFVWHTEKFGNLPNYIQLLNVLDIKAWLKLNFLIILRKEHGQSFQHLFKILISLHNKLRFHSMNRAKTKRKWRRLKK